MKMVFYYIKGFHQHVKSVDRTQLALASILPLEIVYRKVESIYLNYFFTNRT